MRIAYPIRFSVRDSVVHATCPDMPAIAVQAPSRPAARRQMRARLLDALRTCVKEHRDVPRPTASTRREAVELPLLIGAKLALYQTMRDQNVTNVALAKRLGTVEGTVRRLVDLDHRSHVEKVEEALALLGKRLLVEMRSIV